MSYAAAMSEGNNLGSLRSVSLAMAHWFKTFVNDISFWSPNAWELLDCLPENMGIKDESKVTDNGIEYSYTITFAFNKQNVALYNVFAKYLGQHGVLMATDMNGLTRVIGTPRNPVTIVHDADTGERYSSLNFYKLTAKWVSAQPAQVTAP